MGTTLDKLSWMKDLAKYSGRDVANEFASLPEDFLSFSRFLPKPTLRVFPPQMYAVKGDEKKHFSQALKTLGVDQDVDLIGITGDSRYVQLDRHVVILSQAQLQADHRRNHLSYLNPLIEKIYSDGANIIRDFAIHEALIGEVQMLSQGRDIEQLLVQGRQVNGPFTLRTHLDTPSKTIEQYMATMKGIGRLETGLAQEILLPNNIPTLVSDVTDLRKKIGALSRYEVPHSQSFSVETDVTYVHNGHDAFFLYNKDTTQTTVVSFDNPDTFSEQTVDGNSFSAVSELVKRGVFIPNLAVAKLRLSELSEIVSHTDKFTFKKLHADVSDVVTYFSQVANEKSRAAYVSSKPSQVAELVVAPYHNSVIVQELLPKLSWNEHVKQYQQTSTFKDSFDERSTEEKLDFLSHLGSSLYLSDHQNADTNLWLYENHANLCEKAGLTFEIMK